MVRRLLIAGLLIASAAHASRAADDSGPLLVGCYSYLPGDATGIYRISAAGELVRVMAGTCPQWSPDRSEFAFFINDVLWIGNLAGARRGSAMLIATPGRKQDFTWSRDGQFVIFTCQYYTGTGLRSEIARVEADHVGRLSQRDWQPLNLAGDPDADCPAMSPDGRHLAWRGSGDEGGASTIYWAETERLSWGTSGTRDTAPTPLYQFPSSENIICGPPQWSPDSASIACDISDRSGSSADRRRYVILNIETGAVFTPAQPEQTHGRESSWFLGWVTGNEFLAAWGEHHPQLLYRVSLATGDATYLWNAHTAIWDLAVSPDARKVAVVTGYGSPPGTRHDRAGDAGVAIMDLQSSEIEGLYGYRTRHDLKDRSPVPYCVSW